MKLKRKPKVVEAWMVLSRHGDWIAMSMAEKIAKTYVVNPGDHVVRLVPADPHAKLKADVVRAAEKLMWGLPTEPHDASRADAIFWARFDALGRAISKLQKVKS